MWLLVVQTVQIQRKGFLFIAFCFGMMKVMVELCRDSRRIGPHQNSLLYVRSISIRRITRSTLLRYLKDEIGIVVYPTKFARSSLEDEVSPRDKRQVC